jgi:uncharacterized protein (DUF3820 family)
MKLRHAIGVDCLQPRNIEVKVFKDITCPRCRQLLKLDDKLRAEFDKLDLIKEKTFKDRLAKVNHNITYAKNNYSNLRCPKCNGELRSRTNKVSGDSFLGCINYPKCKGTRSPFSTTKPKGIIKSKTRGDNFIMPWGKHKGKSLKNIPIDYLRWVAEQEYGPGSVKRFVKKTENLI